MREISPGRALEEYLTGAVVVLDVRTRVEWVGGHIPRAIHMPMHDLPARFHELDPEADTLVICQHGVRSDLATRWLAGVGFSRVANVQRGMSAWDGPVELGEGVPTPDLRGS